MPNPVPLFFTYLFGEAAPVAYQGASERLLLWASAFEAWLEELHMHHPGTLEHAQVAWRRLLGQQPKLPWELTPADIDAHLAWLKAQGYAACTLYRSLKFVSVFYRWCSAKGVDPGCPPSFNPAAGLSHPLPPLYTGVQLLGRGELRHLLAVLRRDASPVGIRDFAFVLARLRLGVPLGHLQRLQWGQFEVSEGYANVRWRAGCEPVRLPDEVWEALQRYLSASGRLASLLPEAFVFAPLGRPEREQVGDRASDWQAGRALTSRQLWHTLKRYAALAGIPPEKLSLEGLRLTALRLKLDEGLSLEELRLFMDNRSPLKTIKYRLKNLPALPPDPIPEPPEGLAVTVLSHKQFIFQPGEGYKHGMFAHSQPPEEVKAILAEDIHGIEEAVAGLHRLGRGLLERQAQASSASAMARLGDAYTLTAYSPGRDAQGRAGDGRGQARQPGKEVRD